MVLTFAEALEQSAAYAKRHLLLGNGFSIACRPDIFAYGRLYEQANFATLSDTAKKGFEALGTQDFERVIKALRDASRIISAYDGAADLAAECMADSNRLRELLVQTIAASHPAWPGEIGEEEYAALRAFLDHFSTKYTLNYDLLLYWAQMHTDDGRIVTSDDGFRSPEEDLAASYVVWEPGQSHDQDTWYLHGALHVFDAGTEIQKYTWSKTGVRLIDQIRDALARGFFPLFVSEGTSSEKYERIRHNDYLAKAYRSFCSIQHVLFIFGHSFAANDDHYLRCIQRGKVAHLFVSLFGDEGSEQNRFIRRRAEALATARPQRRPLRVTFFSAESA